MQIVCDKPETHSLSPGLRERWLSVRDSDFCRKIAETYATQIATIGLGLLTSVAVARALGPSGRGLYGVALAVGLLGIQFGHLGLHLSNTYHLAKNPLLLPQILGNSLLASLVVGGGGALLAWTVFLAFPHIAPLTGSLLPLALLWVPLGLTYLLLQNILLALHQVRTYNKVDFWFRVVSLSLVAGILLTHHVTPVTMFAASLFALALSSLAILAALRRFPRPSLNLLRGHFTVGLNAYMITFLSFIVLRIDVLMVKYMLGTEPTGYYSIAASLADYLLMLPNVTAMILLPRLSALANFSDKYQQAKSAVLGIALALGPLILVSALCARVVVRLLFGQAFLPAVEPFLWLTPGVFTLGIEVVAVQLLNSLGFPRKVVWIWVVSSATNIAGNLWAIPRYGISGASAVSSITYSLTLVAILAVIYKTKINVRNLDTAYAC